MAGLHVPEHWLRRVYPLLVHRADAADRDDGGLGCVCPRPVIVRGPGHPAHEAARVDRYRLGGMWQWWEPAMPLARWHRVTRRVADDGSCRPVWLAMKQAAAAGQVEVLGPAPDDAAPFGLRITVHATARGPRRAVAISESLVDGIIAAFHAGASTADAAATATALAPRLPGMTEAEIAALAATQSPGPLFGASPFVIKGSYVQISPCDERCQAGQVTIVPGAEGPFMQISGELFTLRRRGS